VYFRQILHPDLGCASYFIADEGEAAVIDPKWEVDEYLAAAADAGAEIRHVLETHNHADHVSGRRRLAAATGAAMHTPDGFGEIGRQERCVVRVGRVELVVVASPGHRPEHVSYLVREQGTDRALLSGDSLLVGDVARPDLAVDAAEGAQALWHTLRRLAALEDEVELWPGHVGGSLCASRAASSATSSTIGQQRRVNPLLTLEDPDAFAAELTCSVPARPPNVERVVALNLEGAADPGPVREIEPRALGRVLDDRVCVIDLRDPESFDAGHLDGSVNLPGDGRGLGTRAGWAAGAGEPIVLVAPSLETGWRGVELMRAAGVWNLAGLTLADPSAWRQAGLAVRTVEALSPDRVLPRIEDGSVELLDVRDLAEWNGGHLATSHWLPLSQLGDGCARAAAVDAPVAVVCASGARAALAASILRRRGCDPVWRVSGSVEELARLGAPMVCGQS